MKCNITCTTSNVKIINACRQIKWYKIGSNLRYDFNSFGGELGAEAMKTIPARAGIGLGIIHCLKCEFPDNLEVLYLDFDPQKPQKYVAENVFNELMRHRKHPEIGYANGKRFEIHWEVEDFKDKKQKFPLNSKSVVLAIGGTRGITASICTELAKRSKAKFIIVGKSPVRVDDNSELKEPITFDKARNLLLDQIRAQGKPIVPAEIDRLAWKHVWQTERLWNMKHLKNIAGEAVYRQCDITIAENVKRLIGELKQEHKRIDLVIQGASDLLEKSTEDIDIGRFIEKMKPKALGTAYLLTALSDIEVGTFINFSSVAGRNS